MTFREVCKSTALCMAMAAALPAQSLLVTAGSAGSATSVLSYGIDPITLPTTFNLGQAAFQVVTIPAGNKYYILSNSTTNSVVAVDSALTPFNPPRAFNLPVPPRSAAVTPDGRRLLVLADTLRVYDTATDTEVTPPTAFGLPSPRDFAISQDSQRAFLLSGNGDTLLAIDIPSLVVRFSRSLNPLATGVGVGPNDVLYATAPGLILELDGRDLTQRAGITVNGTPTDPAFTPDGARLIAANSNLSTGFSVFVVDLTNRVANGIAGNLFIDRITAAGNQRAFGVSIANGQLLDINLQAQNMGAASFSGLAGLTQVRAATVSPDLPASSVGQSRFLFVIAGNVLYRIELAQSALAGSASLPANFGGLDAVAPASFGPISFLTAIGNNQTIAPGATSAPFVVRVLDNLGRPVQGAQVSFNSNNGAQFAPSGATALLTTTNADGLAQVSVFAPTAAGAYNGAITAAAGGSFVSFNYTVGSTSGSASAVTIVSGNGQVLAAGAGAEPLVIEVRDAAGSPVPGAVVSWALSSSTGVLGPGQLLNISTSTDATGRTQASYVAPPQVQSTTTALDTITATIGSVTKTFYIHSYPTVPQPEPVRVTFFPDIESTFTVQAGQTLSNAFRARVTSSLGLPLQNVGLRVVTVQDPAVEPTARCVGEGNVVLTDGNGSATCDLRAGGLIGSRQINAGIGGITSPTYNLVVTPGVPSVINILSGNNQVANVGQPLPQALRAEVRDSFGNLLSGVQVAFEAVVPGTVTFTQRFELSDREGRVAAFAQLGGTVGQVQIRVRSLTGTASAIFTATANANFGRLDKISGDGQTALIGTPFAQPLVVDVRDTNGALVPGATVTFTVTAGSATVNPTTTTTNAQGRAQATVQAGGLAGAVTITAAVVNFSQTFTLTVRPPGPEIGRVANLASNVANSLSPCSLAVVTGTNLTTGQNVRGDVGRFGGGLLNMQGTQVLFGSTAAPIFRADFNSIEFQVPCELSPGTAQMTVRTGDVTAVQSVTLAQYSPGFFLRPLSDGSLRPVMFRPDGSTVTLENRAQRGELIRVLVTGLGQTSPTLRTNEAGQTGVDQTVAASIVIGVNNGGTRVESARYAKNLVGVYEVTFEVPQDVPQGLLNFAVAVQVGESLVFGNGQSIPVQ